MVVQPGCVSRGRRVTGVSGTSTTTSLSAAVAAALLDLPTAEWVGGRRSGARRWTTRRGLHGSESGGDGGRKTADDVPDVATSRCGCDMIACGLYSYIHQI